MVNICQVRLLLLSLRFKHNWTGREGKLEQGLRGGEGAVSCTYFQLHFQFSDLFLYDLHIDTDTLSGRGG